LKKTYLVIKNKYLSLGVVANDAYPEAKKNIKDCHREKWWRGSSKVDN